MRTHRHTLMLILCILLFLTAVEIVAASEEPTVRRYGLFVGANNGGRDRSLLKYAESDAQAVADILVHAGGLDTQNAILLSDPSKQEVIESLLSMNERISSEKRSGTREEFIFYYSGHSDEKGLLLGRERFEYRELRDRLKNVKADVHIAILDSCSSGAFTRLKGGVRRSPFLFDESTEAAGHAFLTSSSANEAAQESDEIGGSFFTHYLLIALSGAGDASNDSRVSLNEAYSFASEETLARTEYTLAGPQHASYDINLTGTGDLVLTDLREGVERISFAEDLAGRVAIRDQFDRLVLEMRKAPDKSLTLTLPPGRYSVILDDGVTLKRTSLSLNSASRIHVTQDSFRSYSREYTVARGGGYGNGNDTRYSGIDMNLMCLREGPMDGIQLGLVGAITEGNMEGIQISSVFSIVEGRMEGVQLSGVFNLVEGEMEGPQIAGVFNISEGNVAGPQLAGVFNIGEGRVEGPQIAGVFNIAEGEQSSGVQIGGVFNVAEHYEGMQYGVVNVAESMSGIQVGVVNIADELNGIPIGLVNIIGDGLHNLSAWYDQNEMINVGFQLGSFYYTFFQGAVFAEDPNSKLSVGLGMGIEMPVGPFYFSTEVYAKTYAEGQGTLDKNIQQAFSDETRTFPALRLTLGKNLTGKTALFGGVDMALHLRGIGNYVPGVMQGESWSFDYSGEGDYLDFYPSWFFGVRF